MIPTKAKELVQLGDAVEVRVTRILSQGIRVVLEKVRDEEQRATIGRLSGYQLQELEAAKGVILDAIYRANNAKQHWLADAIEAECTRRSVDPRPSPVMKNSK